jgi:hypothetical protein
MRLRPMTLAAALAVLPIAAARAEAPRPSGTQPSPVVDGATQVRTVAGKISAVHWEDAHFTVDGGDGPVAIRVDRNTMVLLAARQGSVRDLSVGLPVRASLRADGNLAAWVEVEPPQPAGGAVAAEPGAAREGDVVKDPAGAGERPTRSGAQGGAGTEGAPPTPAPAPAGSTPGSPPGPGPVPGGTGTGR